MTLTVEQYTTRREHIREQHATMRGRAVAYRDQALAKLFTESGWTQQRIADAEGRSQPWVACRLRFGRFCNFLLITAVIKCEKLPVNLTEWKFRHFWETQTGKSSAGGEEKVFKKIVASEEWEMQVADKPSIPTALLIKEHCCDNRYRTKEEIAKKIGVPNDGANRVSNAVQGIRDANRRGLMVIDKTFAGGVIKHKFREVSEAAQKTRASVILAALSPIIEELERGLKCKTDHDKVGLIKGQMHRLHALVKKYS